MGSKNWTLEDFGGGLDLRSGLFSARQNCFRLRLNVFTGKGETPSIERRPPCNSAAGLFDPASQGLLRWKGRHYVVAKKGDVITHTGDLTALVTTLYFDNPDYCTTWHLESLEVSEGFLVALILHDGPAGSQLFLHAFDGLVYAPTYTQDQGFPGSYYPSAAELTGQQYDGTFAPQFTVAVNKVWLPNLAGNVQSSRTAAPRVWNQLTKPELASEGESWAFRVHGPFGSIRQYVVARPASDLSIDQRWAYYVLEKAVGASWVIMQEVTGPPGNDQWRPVSVASRFAGGPNEIQLEIGWGSNDPGLVRLRLVAGDAEAGGPAVEFVGDAPVGLITGAGLTRTLNVPRTTYRYQGGDPVNVSGTTFPIAQGNTYIVGVGPAGYTITNLTTTAFPNGYDRERQHIFLKIVWAPAEANPSQTTLTGTVTVVNGQTGIAGVGTFFGTQLAVGDVVTVGSETREIASITSDTQAAVTVAWTTGSAAVTAFINLDSVYLYAFEQAADSAWYTELSLEYNDLAGAEDALEIASASHDTTGGRATAVREVLDHLLVCYSGSSQLWAIDQDTNATKYLHTLDYGTGDQVRPSPTPFNGAVMIPTQRSMRAVSVIGYNENRLSSTNVGEKIEKMVLPQLRAAAFWPFFGQYVAVGIDPAGAVQFLVLDYSEESKITAWNEWRVAGVADVDAGTLQPDLERLYFRSANRLCWFDAKATLFRDFADTPGAAYVSDAMLHFYDFDSPKQNKRFWALEVVQEGTCSLEFRYPPADSIDEETPGPVRQGGSVTGITYGHTRRRMSGKGPAMSTRFTSQAEGGWRLHRWSVDYIPLRR